MTERFSNLVVPLPHKGTDMRITDTNGCKPVRSGAVSLLSIRQGDVASTISPASPGIRISTTATRTTTTSALSCAPVPSADWSASAGFSFTCLVQAYFDCRRTKRNSTSALAFEERLEYNLRKLFDELQSGAYTPGKSICFVITRPKHREVWAAEFRDRVVHHLLHKKISDRFYRRFIADSCACIPGRGTLYGAQRLQAKVRSQTQNWSRKAFYLKADFSNFFVSIDKHALWPLLEKQVSEPWWRDLAHLVLFHDPRKNYEYRGDPARRWVPVPRLVWEDVHGPIPPKNIVRFKPGMHTAVEEEITPDRLECITKAENMRRNSLHRYPKEIALAIQLRGALTRKINDVSKHSRPA